jgi:hypothetical protein
LCDRGCVSLLLSSTDKSKQLLEIAKIGVERAITYGRLRQRNGRSYSYRLDKQTTCRSGSNIMTMTQTKERIYTAQEYLELEITGMEK